MLDSQFSGIPVPRSSLFVFLSLLSSSHGAALFRSTGYALCSRSVYSFIYLDGAHAVNISLHLLLIAHCFGRVYAPRNGSLPALVAAPLRQGGGEMKFSNPDNGYYCLKTTAYGKVDNEQTTEKNWC